jgi:hypothetical protein
MRYGLVIVITLTTVLLNFACAADKDNRVELTVAATGPTITDLTQIVPSDGLPAEVVPQAGNNNLDITLFEGRYYLAFRTGPSHFANPEVVMYVISSADRVNWDYETHFDMHRDLREPGFLEVGGKLFLYFAVLGTNSIDFEPAGMMISEQISPGDWTEEQSIFEKGFIPWRTKSIDGVPYIIGYIGGENIYDFGTEELIDVYWLTTSDGYHLEPVVPGQPIVLTSGGSETDIVFLDDGSLIAVSRNELGDESGWGMKICRAHSESLGDWECVGDPRKYDSPLLFRHGSEVYLIGRRNLSDTGNYDLDRRDLSSADQILLYEATYWRYPKRTSLWKINKEKLTVSFVQDFPSKGDTCFPSMIKLNAKSYLVYNYSSPIDGPDVDWVTGQTGETGIYSTILNFP